MAQTEYHTVTIDGRDYNVDANTLADIRNQLNTIATGRGFGLLEFKHDGVGLTVLLNGSTRVMTSVGIDDPDRNALTIAN
jgi:hypothetical protein